MGRSRRASRASTSSAVYFATSAIFAAVMALLVWALALRLTGDRRVAAIAAVLACLGGGMGWMRLVGDVLAGNPDVAAS